MIIRSVFIIFCSVLLLVGCSGVKAPPATRTSDAAALVTAPSASTVEPEQPVQHSGGETVVVEPIPRPAMSGNRAVIALLDRANIDNQAGKRDTAGASLERALRIEPRNPWLWLELAQVRLAQGQYSQAITLAHKSNSFAGRQARLLSESWQLIGQARVAQGDAAGAELAFKQAREFELQVTKP